MWEQMAKAPCTSDGFWSKSIQGNTAVLPCINLRFAVILEASLRVRCWSHGHVWVMGGGGMISIDGLLVFHAERT